MKKPLVLCIMDGVGIRKETEHNAWALAKTPWLDSHMKEGKYALLEAAEEGVGLIHGQMGSSEVGHLNIGAGRIVKQLFPRIRESVLNGSFKDLPVLKELIEILKKTKGTCHIWGLLSTGSVHSHQDHIIAPVLALAKEGIRVKLHILSDGRDTPPKSELEFLKQFEKEISIDSEIRKKIEYATLTGRYFGMDRDKNFERTQIAWNAIVMGNAEYYAKTPEEAVKNAYERGETDEFIKPTIINNYKGVSDGDGLLIANYRTDRVLQIARSLALPKDTLIERPRVPKWALCVGMADYAEDISKVYRVLFPKMDVKNTIGDILEKNGLRQLRVAESEKSIYVSFFMDGAKDKTFQGGENIFIKSPRVETFDLAPEMKAKELTDIIEKKIDNFDVVIVNYANGDIVGHTGVENAAITAMETVDKQLKRLEKIVRKRNGVLLITADHGDCEIMWEKEQPHTAHTTNPVPFIIVANDEIPLKYTEGKLADIAPTMLTVLDLDIPSEMTGKSLI